MPSNSFKLVLEADGTPARTAELFEVAKQDAAWQEAYEKSCASKAPLLEPWIWWSKQRTTDVFIGDGFSDAIREIFGGTSVVECGFDVSGPCGVDVDVVDEQAVT